MRKLCPISQFNDPHFCTNIECDFYNKDTKNCGFNATEEKYRVPLFDELPDSAHLPPSIARDAKFGGEGDDFALPEDFFDDLTW